MGQRPGGRRDGAGSAHTELDWGEREAQARAGSSGGGFVGESIGEEALFAPATARNGGAILEVLQAVLPPGGTVLEVASGTGEHAVRFAAALPGADLAAERSGSAGARQHPGPCPRGGPAEPAAPARTRCPIRNLAGGAGGGGGLHQHDPHRALGRDGRVACGRRPAAADGRPLVLYGPFRLGGAHTAESNARFDDDLRMRDPEWGVRDLEAVLAAAAGHGLHPSDRIAMPANNLGVVLRKA